MNLSIIIPAMLMAIAAIACIRFLSEKLHQQDARNEFLVQMNGRQKKSYDDLMERHNFRLKQITEISGEISDLKKQLPAYGRDPKTGKFVKRSA